MVAIKSINLRKIFPKEQDSVYALSDCNVEINEGEFVVINGAKASGKTTLLHLLGGYERPSGGAIYINNNNISLYDEDELAIMRRKEVGYLFQNNSLIPELSVHVNIIMPTIISRKKYDDDYYKDLTESLNIAGILSSYPKQLSPNQLRYVTLARALITKPNILLIDEPTDDIYSQMDIEVLDYLLNIVYKYNKTLIMVTNNLELSSYANHIIKLRSGVIVEDIRL